MLLRSNSGGSEFCRHEPLQHFVGSLVRNLPGLLRRGKGGRLFGLALLRSCRLVSSQQHVVGRVGGPAVARPPLQVPGLQVALKPVAIGVDSIQSPRRERERTLPIA